MPDAPYRPDRAIVLVGPMGAGKSTVGRLLAERLALPFADTDDEIERDTGMTIAEIFERYGEARFREQERRMIAGLVDGTPRVVATGGGAFADAEIRTLILARCIAIWLDGDVETLAGRVGTGAQRPLLRGRNPHTALAALAEARNPLYAEAHLRIDTDARLPEEIVDTIVSALRSRA